MTAKFAGIGLLVLSLVGLALVTGYIGLPGDRTSDVAKNTCSQGNHAACERVCRLIGGENVPGLICREHPARRGVDAGSGNQSPSGQPGEPPRSPTPGDNPGGGGSGSSPSTIGQQIGGIVDTATQQACSVTGQLGQQVPVCP